VCRYTCDKGLLAQMSVWVSWCPHGCGSREVHANLVADACTLRIPPARLLGCASKFPSLCNSTVPMPHVHQLHLHCKYQSRGRLQPSGSTQLVYFIRYMHKIFCSIFSRADMSACRGFERERAERALIATGNDVAAALELLVS